MLWVTRTSTCRRLLTNKQNLRFHVDLFISQTLRELSTNSHHEYRETHRGTKKCELADEERQRKLWLHLRQASIITKYGAASTEKNDVLVSFRDNFQMTKPYSEGSSKKPHFYTESDQALVILATPGYATWLEDDVSFIPGILQNLIRPIKDPSIIQEQAAIGTSKEPNGPPFEVDVICACVDGLAPSIKQIKFQKARPIEEGFSFLYGRSSQIVPDLWEPEPSNISNSPGMQSSLTFTGESRNASQVTLPLANTLFRNGRNSTLLTTRWQAQPDGSFQKVKSGEKNNQLIKIFHNTKPGIPSTSISVVPLTPARPIVSGLGNIVRQIRFSEEIGPASRELEDNIDEYFDHTKQSKSALAVWALVVPKESHPTQSQEPPDDLLFNADDVKRFWVAPDERSTLIGHWIDRGASICRVLSGGGGWGAKQGLLSLDPQTTYKSGNEARFDFSNGSLEEERVPALGNIARPNAYIQFFLANSDIPFRQPVETPDWSEAAELAKNKEKEIHADVYQASTVLGAVPSTIDDISNPESSPGKAPLKDSTLFQNGHFGALSESGIYYNSTVVKDFKSGEYVMSPLPISTKIDVPYSYFFQDYD